MATPLQFDIVPRDGIGPVHLGMLPAEVNAILESLPGALPLFKKSQTVECFFDASLQIEFGESGRAQFIGVSNHPRLLCMFYGQDVFDIAAPDLFALIASKEQAGTHAYSPSEYLFPEQIVTLYEADEQYDHKRNGARSLFAEVGVGNDEYLIAVRSIGDGAMAG